MGIEARRAGMMTLTPECLQPLMAPPLASTMKLTKNVFHLSLETTGRVISTLSGM